MKTQDKPIDLTGLKCPLPVLQAQKILRDMPPGAEITVHVTDPASTIDMPHFCNTAGHELLSSERQGEIFVFRIKKA